MIENEYCSCGFRIEARPDGTRVCTRGHVQSTATLQSPLSTGMMQPPQPAGYVRSSQSSSQYQSYPKPQPQQPKAPVNVTPDQQPMLATRPGPFRPFLKILCPYCGKRFHPSDCPIFSQIKGKVLKEAPDGPSHYLKRLWIEELTGTTNREENACRLCPHCRKALPVDFEFSNNLNIAIVGDTSSGKSHYIAAFLNQLLTGGMAGKDSSYAHFEAQNAGTKKLFEDYSPFLHDHSRLLASAAAIKGKTQRDPLIYELQVRHSINQQSAYNNNLIIYDIAGEDFADRDRLAEFGWPIVEAQAIIYLADPFSMKNLRSRLPAQSQSASAIQAVRQAHEVITSVARVTRREKKMQEGERIDIPVAVMLPKSDLLEEAFKATYPNFRLWQHSPAPGVVKRSDGAAVDREVRQLLYDLEEWELLKQDHIFSKLSFFATSATGCAADKNGNFPKVEPRRCLDPLLWVLWQLQTGIVSVP